MFAVIFICENLFLRIAWKIAGNIAHWCRTRKNFVLHGIPKSSHYSCIKLFLKLLFLKLLNFYTSLLHCTLKIQLYIYLQIHRGNNGIDGLHGYHGVIYPFYFSKGSVLWWCGISTAQNSFDTLPKIFNPQSINDGVHDWVEIMQKLCGVNCLVEATEVVSTAKSCIAVVMKNVVNYFKWQPCGYENNAQEKEGDSHSTLKVVGQYGARSHQNYCNKNIGYNNSYNGKCEHYHNKQKHSLVVGSTNMLFTQIRENC